MSTQKKDTLLVIDGHAMAYRAYFSMQQQNMTHPTSGQPTGAIYGFFRMLFKVLFELAPKHVAVVWDPPKGRSFRNELYPEYKANRKPMPEDLRPQIEEIRNLISECGFAALMEKGYEADDLMGSLSKHFSKTERVILLSGDKDCYQLLGKNVHMLRPKKGVTEFVEIDPKWVEKELGIKVSQVTDYMALVGDSSDNIPGAKGIGPKGAAKLLQEYKNLDSIYKNIDKISAKALKKKLIESKEDVFLSKELVIIKTDLSSMHKLDPKALLLPDLLRSEVLQLFRNAGLNQIYQDLKKRREARAKASPSDDSLHLSDEKEGDEFRFDPKNTDYRLVTTEEGLVSCLKELKKALKKKTAVLSLDTETDHVEPMRARLVGVSLSVKEAQAWYLSCLPEDSPYAETSLSRTTLIEHLGNFLKETKPRLVGQNIKYDIIVLRRAEVRLPDPYFDTMLASYLCNPHIRKHNMDDMALDYLGYTTIPYGEVAGSGKKKTTLDQLPPDAVKNYACEDADITLRLYQALKKEIKKRKLENVHKKIEMPLVPVLVSMEMSGVAIDLEYFGKLQKKYKKKISELEAKIHKAAGRPFNIRSTKELQEILFTELNLGQGKGKKRKKTKTGYSTDQSVLEGLRDEHEIIDFLLEYRKYTKLQSTYVEALPAMVHPETGRLHTSFHQAIAATGRLSSVEPNLQNIPIREETGRAIRRGFVAAPGNVLLSLDYSQIELRIMAHFSEDEGLLEVFRSGKIDIHTRTAGRLFEVPESEVTEDMRALGKTVNFAIIYGVTKYGLSKNLGVSQNEAELYIERFFASFPGVRTYMDDTIAFAQKHGYVETLTGRRRQIPEIASTNRFRREGAERTAINSPIQGTSADIIKLAMIDIHKKMQERSLDSRMILQVHDELLFDVSPSEKEEVLLLAKESMENAMKLLVPLKVEHSFGANWDEAH